MIDYPGIAKNRDESAYPELWDGLIGAWDMRLGVDGELLPDRSGYGNDGTLNNMIVDDDWIVDNERDWVLDFDGQNDYVRIANHDVLNPDTGLTVAVWLKPTVDGQVEKVVVGKPFTSQALPSHQYALLWDDSAGKTNRGIFFLALNGLLKVVNTGAEEIMFNEWSHFVGTYDGATMRTFVNGIEKRSKAQTGTINTYTTDLFLCRSDNDVIHFGGQVSQVLIYDRALSALEILRLYDLTKHIS